MNDPFRHAGEEVELLREGHTMSVVSAHDTLFAYKGNVDFSAIELLTGNSLDALQSRGTVLRNRRWASVLHDGSMFHLFCTFHRNNRSDLFKYQDIYQYRSRDGVSFEGGSVVAEGSAPCITRENGIYRLFYHRKRESHDILVRTAENIGDLTGVPERILVSVPITAELPALSAPSVMRIGNRWYMLCEFRKGDDPWKTIWYWADSIDGPYTYGGLFMDGWRACAFLHEIGGKPLVLYSRRREGIWNISMRSL